MDSDTIKKALISLACILSVYSFSGCTTTGGGIHVGWLPESGPIYRAKKGGPPPHAPAHGYRAKHKYRYYPSSCVYFDVGRKVYFYIEGVSWRASASLPHHIRIRLGNYVNIEMDTDKPYARYEEHKRKYPPGQLKKKKNKKWAKK